MALLCNNVLLACLNVPEVAYTSAPALEGAVWWMAAAQQALLGIWEWARYLESMHNWKQVVQ